MYRVAICDNNEQTVKEISEILYKKASKCAANIQIYKYTDAEALLASSIKLNLIFMDIDISGINGITLAKKIRLEDPRIQIVFVTKNLNYIKDAYRIHVFDYIEKPFKPSRISRVFEDYMKFASIIKSDILKITQNTGRELLIPTDEIMYISCGAKKREVIIITKDKDYTCKGEINEIYSELNNFDFFMPHRSHIINLWQVKSYVKNKTIFMMNNDEMPLSRGRSNEFEKIIKLYEL